MGKIKDLQGRPLRELQKLIGVHAKIIRQHDTGDHIWTLTFVYDPAYELMIQSRVDAGSAQGLISFVQKFFDSVRKWDQIDIAFPGVFNSFSDRFFHVFLLDAIECTQAIINLY